LMGSFEFNSEKLPSSATNGRVPPRIEGQLSSHAAISKAHHFFGTGAEAHAFANPGLIPGANEPISPLIQMILRMPGHIGIFNSFFEALQAMILPHLNFLPHLDPSILGAHLHDAANAAIGTVGGHPHIDLAALPGDAHIFQSLQLDGSILNAGQMQTHLTGADLIKHSLNVSGTPDIGKPIYEGTGQPILDPGTAMGPTPSDGALAGPALSDHGVSNHLAGAHRIFSHNLFERPGSGMNSPLSPSAQSTANLPVNQPNGLPPQQYSSHSMLNVNGNPFAQPSSAPAVGDTSSIYRPALNAGYHMGAPAEQALSGGTPLGPSGAVSDQLGSRHVMASDQGVETFKPTVGGDSSPYDASSLQESAPVTGMHARQLTLDGGGKLAHSSSHFHSASGDTNTNGQSHLNLVRKPLSGVKDQIAHRTINSKAYSPSASNQIATLPKHAHPIEHTVKNIKPASTLSKNAISETAKSTDSTRANASDRPSTYVIRSGDCLWNIAKHQLGDARQWQEIYKLNADTLGSNPDLIHPGTSIQLPNASQDLASHGMNASKYVVRSGDNLWNISKNLMGSGEKWGQLYHMNSDVIGANPRLILPGQELTLPGSDVVASNSAAPITDTAGMQQPIDNNMAQTVTAPQTTMAEPVAQPAASAAPAAVPDGIPAASAPEATQSVLSGPGGAQAATLAPQPTQNDPSVVSPSLAPDLSFFANGKR
jgi:LysM repeat protein